MKEDSGKLFKKKKIFGSLDSPFKENSQCKIT